MGGLKLFGTKPRITTTKPRPPFERPPSFSNFLPLHQAHVTETRPIQSSDFNHLAKMNINKKLDRVKQWAGEKMGAESKTNVSDEFKALEMEMQLRHEGTFARQIHKTDGC